LKINGEVILLIHHYLFSKAEIINDVKTVYAHPQALA
jgi:chorismate mutase/prephenate dehydratase